jgi:predicted nucleic acid-binding protein
VNDEFVLDASFSLCWCFEDEATEGTDSVLTTLQNQKAVAWAPGIWQLEILNGLGKGVARGRVDREKAFLFWREMRALPVHIIDIPADEKLLELALEHNLALYDAAYLSLALVRGLPLATADGKLQRAAQHCGLGVMRP